MKRIISACDAPQIPLFAPLERDSNCGCCFFCAADNRRVGPLENCGDCGVQICVGRKCGKWWRLPDGRDIFRCKYCSPADGVALETR